MGVLTTLLKLLKPDENDYYNQQTEQADNWQKVDDYAVLTNADKNAIWGGLDGGGLIEDPSVTKVVGKRYIGADGKAYICLVPSNINNSTNYAPCNTVDNLSKLQNLYKISETIFLHTDFGPIAITKQGNVAILEYTPSRNNFTGTTNSAEIKIADLPDGFSPSVSSKIGITVNGSSFKYLRLRISAEQKAIFISSTTPTTSDDFSGNVTYSSCTYFC